MRIPNLFILGAPKCGTTALAHWLGAHPEIYAPSVKEPHYFSSEYRLTKNRAVYEGFYEGWQDEQKWAFDASVWQLYSTYAVPAILRERPDARFICMARNPMTMIPSMHRQQLYNGNELESDLASALQMNDRREKGERAKVLSRYPPDHLAYFHSCGLGWQAERLHKLVSPAQVHWIIHDDLERDPDGVLCAVYSFLELDPKMPESFARINAAKVRRFPAIDRATKAMGDWKSRRGFKLRLGILAWARKMNQEVRRIDPIDPELEDIIRDRMAGDVHLLGDQLGQNLNHWLSKA